MSIESLTPVACDEKPPLKWVSKEEMRPGDLLFSSSDMAGWFGKIVWLGQMLDGVGYSHCAIFDGNNVVETKLKDGVTATPVDEALIRNRYTDIHRFLADDREGELGDEGWPHRPVTRTALNFIGRGYAVSDAVVAALLLIIRKSVLADVPTSDLIRKALDVAVRFFQDLLSSNPPPCHLTCSELLYRSFNNAVPSHRYRIAIDERPYESVKLPSVEGNRITEDELIEIPIYEKMSFATALLPPRAADAGQKTKIVTDIQKLAAEFESLYQQANFGAGPTLVPSGRELDGEMTYSIKFETVADYVSPGDLVMSHNTREIGRIRKPSR